MTKRSTTALATQMLKAQETAALVLDETPDDAALVQALTTGLTTNGTADDQQYLEWANHDHQNLIKRLRYLEDRAHTLINRLTPNQQRVALAALTPTRTLKDIAERTQLSPATVSKYLKTNATVTEFLKVSLARRALNAEPSRAWRLQLAWRIAMRSEINNPKVAIAALQLIANQSGELQKQEDGAKQAPTIVLAQFNTTVQAPTNQQPPTSEHANNALDGEFTTVSMEVTPRGSAD